MKFLNTDWAWKDIKATTTNILRRYFSRTTFAHSSSAIQFHSPFQPGGTMTIAGGKWGTRSTPSSDPRAMGRWSAITIVGRIERRVTIFSVYRVCDQRFASTGIKTAFRQQFLMAADLAIYPNEPRKLLLKDLGNTTSNFRDQGHEIIILMDANESFTRHNSAIAIWTNQMELLDPITLRHGLDGQPSRVDTGSARIGFILTSRNLTPYIRGAGILSKYHFVDSDHQALFMDIDLDSYLQGIPTDVITQSHRGITSDNPKAVRQYQKHLTQALDNSTIEAQLQVLLQIRDRENEFTDAHRHMANEIDRTSTNMKLAAEADCRHTHKSPWSPLLECLRSEVLYWNLWFRQPTSRTDGSSYRARICPHLPALIAPSYTFIKTSLREAQAKFKLASASAPALRTQHMIDLAKLYSHTNRASESSIVQQILRCKPEKPSFDA